MKFIYCNMNRFALNFIVKVHNLKQSKKALIFPLQRGWEAVSPGAPFAKAYQSAIGLKPHYTAECLLRLQSRQLKCLVNIAEFFNFDDETTSEIAIISILVVNDNYAFRADIYNGNSNNIRLIEPLICTTPARHYD